MTTESRRLSRPADMLGVIPLCRLQSLIADDAKIFYSNGPQLYCVPQWQAIQYFTALWYFAHNIQAKICSLGVARYVRCLSFIARKISKIMFFSSAKFLKFLLQVSTNIVRKYCGPVDVWWSIFESYFCQKEEICFLPNKSPRLSANAMAQHSSQWVW